MTDKKQLKISSKLSLPLDAVTSTIVVYGGKGMGKTNLASVLVEEFTAAHLRFAVIDPMGVWWGLPHSVDGKGRGIEVLILGGIHGGLPIEPSAGAVVADLVVDEDVSVIIDISRRPDGSMWSIGERVKFVTAFTQRVYQRQGEKRRPLHLVIDEAARFAPQVIRSGDLDVAKCMGAVAVLVEEGRNVGIGVTMVTQRSARLNKDVAELADCMIAFRVIGPNSMDAVLDWLGKHVEKARLKEVSEQLRELPRGSALVVSPGWLEFEGIVPMRARTTFDSSATPKPGEQLRASGAGAKPDLAKYRERLAEVVERAKADDPKELRAKIATLTKENETMKKMRTETEVVPKSKRPKVVQLDPKKADALISKIQDAQRALVAGAEKILVRAEALRVEMDRSIMALVARTTPPIAFEKLEPQKGLTTITTKYPPPKAVMQAYVGHLSGKAASAIGAQAHPPMGAGRKKTETNGVAVQLEPRQLKILNAIAWWEGIGDITPPASGVAFIAGYSPSSSSYERARGFLRGAGLITYPSPGTVALTVEGGSIATYPESPGTVADLHAAVLQKLEPRQQKLLRPLLDCYPESLSIADHAAAADYSPDSSSYERARGFIRSLGLADYPKPGHVRATDLLFPTVLR